ncbi:CBS and ACT domain-containing protein [Alkalicoccobacillus murimartini]|uniref:Acetoin utilization protein AcuB n=1 Tax=Alkalicoccobacillus murimartini TaxID=171685 RepID=A0ABT9YJX2_9BACI|nr:CBS and ACT domain-containing protein [Alkalicoccobacillus murimartini]MDQ0208150.1 acetoin utilization protein AcuB [Alkalicoccobacillus murimartini]
MKVKDIMQRDLVTLTVHHTIKDALHLLEKNRIRHIAIVDDKGQIEGIVSDRDIRDARPSIFEQRTDAPELDQPVTTVMSTKIITAEPDDLVQEVASVFYLYHIGCLPITEEDRLVGMVTETDLLHTFVELMGADQPSTQIDVEVSNSPGQLASIAIIFKEFDINIHSVMVYPSESEQTKTLLFRAQTIDARHVIKAIEEAGFNVKGPTSFGELYEDS